MNRGSTSVANSVLDLALACTMLDVALHHPLGSRAFILLVSARDMWKGKSRCQGEREK